MSERESKYFDGGDRVSLASAVVARRNAMGWTQREACARGGLSDEKLRQFENGADSGRIQFRSLAALDEAMCWYSGSALAVLNGGEPTEAPVPPKPRRSQAGGAGVEVGLSDGDSWTAALAEPSWSIDEAGHLHVSSRGDVVTTFAAGHWRFINKDDES